MSSERDFINACKNGDLQKAKHILSTNYTINNLQNITNAFKNTCKKGHLHVAKWLFSLREHQCMNIMSYDIESFVWSCGYGHLQVAQYLYEKNSNINIYDGANDALLYSCGNGYLHVAQWLLTLPNKYTNHDYSKAFIYACYTDKLSSAKWLYSIKPEICMDTITNGEYIFLEACKYNYADIALWLQSLMPFTYFVEKNDIINWDNTIFKKITNYGIRNTIESNTLAIINMLEKTGYGNELHADLLCKIANK